MLGVPLGHLHPTGVRRHHHGVVAVGADVALEHRHRREVVDGAVEEALDLPRVEIDRHHALGPGGAEHVGHETGGDRLPSARLAVLAGVAEDGAAGGDALGRGPVGGVDHDELLHDRVVDRAAVAAVVALHDEDVGAADALGVARADLAVGEGDQAGLAQLDVEMVGDLLGQRRVARPGVQRQAFLGDPLQRHDDPV